MSDNFFDDEAEEASSSEAEHEEEREGGENLLSDDERIVKKSKKKKVKKSRRVHSDDDEEDGEDLDRDLEDLIDDNPIEEDADEGGSEGEGEDESGEKRKHEDSDLDEDLEDDDYELIEENLGIKVQRKRKRTRIVKVSDDEEDEGAEGMEANEKEVIQNDLFDSDAEDDDAPHVSEPVVKDSAAAISNELEDIGSGEESDENDFIVDDQDQPISQVKKKKHVFHDDAALQEAQELFGVDFDFDDLEQLGEEEEEDDEELEQEDEYEQDEEGEEGAEPRVRPPKPARKQKQRKTTIYEVFEPSDLERSHFTDFDQEVRMADLPERFQLRGTPVCPAEEGELEEEAEWIYKYSFSTPPLSRQEYFEQEHGRHGGGTGASAHKSPGTVHKIREALNLMRNQKFEVPFIAFYRKEYIEPELNIVDVWKIYHCDEKWMQLRSRKQNLVRLFHQMQEYQFELVDADKPLNSSFRTLTEEDIERAKGVQTMEELHDVYQHFQLYYGADVAKMKASVKAKKKKEALEAAGEEPQPEEDEPEQKHPTRKTGYMLCVEAGLVELARKFGLSPEQMGENLRDNYQRHEVDQDPTEPLELAAEFVNKQFPTARDVLDGAGHVVAMQIAHDPVVRQCVRQTFYERAKISVRPTKKGMKEIDESHACFTFKYLKNKPVQDLSEDQFLRITQAVEDQLLTYEMHIDEKDNPRITGYFDEIKQLYHRDEFSNLVQEWNKERSDAFEKALTKILFPQLIKELKAKLLEEAKESIIKASCRKLYSWLKVAPYVVDHALEEDEEDLDTSHGVRVMGLVYTTKRDEASFCAVIDGDGEVLDFLRLAHITKRKLSPYQEEREHKEADLQKVKDFILAKKPHVIAVGAESRDALRIIDDLKAVVGELEQEHSMVPINVELVDLELAAVFANSKKSEHDMREYPTLLRQAVSLARRLQDPLVEFSQLCNADEDILCLRYHSLQDAVNKDDLIDALHLEFINRVNEVGVDVNRCIGHPHTAALVQFVCGLGPRKGNHLLKTLKQNNTPLENRTQLVTHQHVRMGPKVFLNCSGFIKINTSALADSTEQYVEVLDGSRIHPETYEWARKMAVDALEYDDTAEDANPAGALEEILESPERLKDLDLDAFAEELQRQGYGDKHITLYDIRAELNHRYKDLRTPYRSCTHEERFNLLTKETPQTFYIGKLMQCQATGIAHKRPQGEQLEVAHPVRNDETGLWQCPFCQKNNFPELSEVWNHFDAGGCPGQAVGVKTRLDNGVNGFIPLRNLSDKHVTNPADRVKIGMMLHCRITKIEIERFNVELTSKSSDLIDAEGKWKLQRDPFYDFELEEMEKHKEEEVKKSRQARQDFVKRVIAHPQFQNIDYKTCEKQMLLLDQGDVIIRPSRKSTDHLTVTWKVGSRESNILQHIDVREERKENSFSIGKCLWIEGESFEDLDEIIARNIQPMASFARDILSYKNYIELDSSNSMDVLEARLAEEKKRQPGKIPYFFTACAKFPGKFLLSYLPRRTAKHEFLTVTPEGLRYRGRMFHSLSSLIHWFKEHFRDPIPGTPMMGIRTPMGTPVGGVSVDAAAIQRAAQGLSSNMFNTLQQVAGQRTPYGGPGTGYGQYQGPLATPMMTPMMTPGQHPGHHPMATPGSNMGPPSMRHLPINVQTPQYQMTPRVSNYPITPNIAEQSPRSQWPAANRSGPPVGVSQQPRGGRVEAERGMRGDRRGVEQLSDDDWAKKAALWAQSQAGGSGANRSTPRRTPVRQSPYRTPGGDQTPLVDEDR